MDIKFVVAADRSHDRLIADDLHLDAGRCRPATTLAPEGTARRWPDIDFRPLGT